MARHRTSRPAARHVRGPLRDYRSLVRPGARVEPPGRRDRRGHRGHWRPSPLPWSAAIVTVVPRRSPTAGPPPGPRSPPWSAVAALAHVRGPRSPPLPDPARGPTRRSCPASRRRDCIPAPCIPIPRNPAALVCLSATPGIPMPRNALPGNRGHATTGVIAARHRASRHHSEPRDEPTVIAHRESAADCRDPSEVHPIDPACRLPMPVTRHATAFPSLESSCPSGPAFPGRSCPAIPFPAPGPPLPGIMPGLNAIPLGMPRPGIRERTRPNGCSILFHRLLLALLLPAVVLVHGHEPVVVQVHRQELADPPTGLLPLVEADLAVAVASSMAYGKSRGRLPARRQRRPRPLLVRHPAVLAARPPRGDPLELSSRSRTGRPRRAARSPGTRSGRLKPSWFGVVLVRARSEASPTSRCMSARRPRCGPYA